MNNNKHIKKFGLHNLYEWKFILSTIKVYLNYYTVTDKMKNAKYFDDKELLLLSIDLYFKYPQNNIYQNIFHEIIKLICLEECPYYLIEPFLIIDNEQKQNKFIFNLLKNIKINKDKKYNSTIGIDLEILKLFYSSNNKAILNHFKESDLDNKYKSIFIKDSIKYRLDKQLNEDYEYTNDEIFDIEKDKDDTFDGNDCEINKEFLCFKNIISNFLDKVEEEEEKHINKINNGNNNKNQLNIMEKKKNENEIQKIKINDIFIYNVDKTQYEKIEEKKIENKNNPEITKEVKYLLEEKESNI